MSLTIKEINAIISATNKLNTLLLESKGNSLNVEITKDGATLSAIGENGYKFHASTYAEAVAIIRMYGAGVSAGFSIGKERMYQRWLDSVKDL